MKIAVIGSTSPTGRQVLTQGLQRGHSITAFTRRPQELAEITGLHAIVQGDGRNADDLMRAVRGQDAVIAIVGVTRNGSPTAATDVTRTLISVMDAAGVGRMACVSAYPVAGTRPRLLMPIIKRVFRTSYADLAKMEQLLFASDLDWTILRPMRLTNGPATGKLYRERTPGDFTGGSFRMTMSRADLATALLDAIADPADRRATIAVTTAR